MRFIPVKDAVDIRLLGSLDYLKRDRMRLLKWAKHVYADLNLTAMKVAQRQYFQVNKKTNSIDLPCPFDQFSSLNVVHCGVEIPVYRNHSISAHDIFENDAAKDCVCEFDCGHKLCSVIKNYVAVSETVTDKLPDNTDITFTCVERKWVDSNGFFYQQVQYPKRVYTYNSISGQSEWTNTILATENKKLCEVEVDKNGCICDTQQNIDKVCNCCGWTDNNGLVQGNSPVPVGGNAECPPNPTDDTWIYWCSSKMDWFSVQCGAFPKGFRPGCYNVYNIDELGNRLVFPKNFGWDKVLVRWYGSINTNDLQIPYIALDVFIIGLMWWDCRFNDMKQPLADKYGQQYTNMKFALIQELNKYRIAEQRMILTPPVFIPSYIPINYWYGYGWYNPNSLPN